MKILTFALIIVVGLLMVACGGGKQSAVEGTLVDGAGKPVAGVKINASQVQPIKGYELLETVTESDGTFHIRGLFPSSRYVLKPWSDKWTTSTKTIVESAPDGETAVLPAPMVIKAAYSNSGGGLVSDLATGYTRFTVVGSVIADSETGLEWLIGPSQTNRYSQAEKWVASMAADGWRFPSRHELASLYEKGFGSVNRNPLFSVYNSTIWAEPDESSTTWYFSFSTGKAYLERRNIRNAHFRAFAVRSSTLSATPRRSVPANAEGGVQHWNYFCTDGADYNLCSRGYFTVAVPWDGRNLDRDTEHSEDASRFARLLRPEKLKADAFCRNNGFTEASQEWPLLEYMLRWHNSCKVYRSL